MNKKGFTLIEVLAVLIVLSILAAIASPIIANIMTDAEEKTAEIQIKSIANLGIQSRIDNNYMGDITLTITEEKISYYIDDKEVIINYVGEKPTSGTIFINSDGDYSANVIIINECYAKNIDSDSIEHLEKNSCN